MSTETIAVPVQYVGIKPVKVDNVANTGLTWTPQQVHPVTALEAQKLARHPDVWQIVAPEDVSGEPTQPSVSTVATQIAEALLAARAQEQAKQEQQSKDAQSRQTIGLPDLPDLNNMGKRELLDYAESRYNQRLDGRSSKQALVSQIVTLANSLAARDV